MTLAADEIAVFCGLDVGKGEHHATALNQTGKRLHDKKLVNTEPRLRELFTSLIEHGPVLVVVDQPASIGALPVAVARDTGCQIAYLPGLTMRRLADLHPGESTTDACDAFVIAEAARTLPHTLRSIDTDDETVAELTMLTGFDEDLAAESTRLRNRIRGLLTQIHPSLERVLGRRLDHPGVLALLEAFPTPAMMASPGRDALLEVVTPHAPRMAERLVTDVFTALEEQTVVVAGTSAAATILPHLTGSLRSILQQRDTVAAQVEHLLADHPLSAVGDLDPRHRGLRPPPASSSKSATPADSAVLRTWPPTPASHPPPAAPAAASAAKAPPVEATNSSNEPCTSRPSPPCATPNHRLTTSGNGLKENTTSPR